MRVATERLGASLSARNCGCIRRPAVARVVGMAVLLERSLLEVVGPGAALLVSSLTALIRVQGLLVPRGARRHGACDLGCDRRG